MKHYTKHSIGNNSNTNFYWIQIIKFYLSLCLPQIQTWAPSKNSLCDIFRTKLRTRILFQTETKRKSLRKCKEKLNKTKNKTKKKQIENKDSDKKNGKSLNSFGKKRKNMYRMIKFNVLEVIEEDGLYRLCWYQTTAPNPHYNFI